MKRLGIGLVCFILLFFSIHFSSAFTNFLISPESINFTLSSLEINSSDIVVSFSSILPQEDEEQPYRIERYEVCNEWDEWGYDCIDTQPNLCPYISMQPNGGEGDETGFPLDYYFPWNIAEGELKNPSDTADNWTLSVKAPCFVGECPTDYDSNLYGEPLPQILKNQTS